MKTIKIDPKSGKLLITKPKISFKRRVYDFLEYPELGKNATRFSAFLMLTILVSVVTFMVESEPSLKDENNKIKLPGLWLGIEIFCTTVFTLEMAFKLWCYNVEPIDKDEEPEPRWKFWTSILNIFDFLAIVPTYIELLSWIAELNVEAQGLRVLRIVRLTRVLRMLRAAKGSETTHALKMSITQSSESLYLMGFVMLIWTILCASVMFLISDYKDCLPACVPSCFSELDSFGYATMRKEFGPDQVWEPPACSFDSCMDPDFQPYQVQACALGAYNRPNDFTPCQCPLAPCNRYNTMSDIPIGMWFTVVTMFTIGYGSEVPCSTGGKAVAIVCMVVGILIMSLPMAIIASKFQDIYLGNEEKNKELERERQRILEMTKHQAQHDQMVANLAVSSTDEDKDILAFIEQGKILAKQIQDLTVMISKVRQVNDLLFIDLLDQKEMVRQFLVTHPFALLSDEELYQFDLQTTLTGSRGLSKALTSLAISATNKARRGSLTLMESMSFAPSKDKEGENKVHQISK